MMVFLVVVLLLLRKPWKSFLPALHPQRHTHIHTDTTLISLSQSLMERIQLSSFEEGRKKSVGGKNERAQRGMVYVQREKDTKGTMKKQVCVTNILCVWEAKLRRRGEVTIEHVNRKKTKKKKMRKTHQQKWLSSLSPPHTWRRGEKYFSELIRTYTIKDYCFYPHTMSAYETALPVWPSSDNTGHISLRLGVIHRHSHWSIQRWSTPWD